MGQWFGARGGSGGGTATPPVTITKFLYNRLTGSVELELSNGSAAQANITDAEPVADIAAMLALPDDIGQEVYVTGTDEVWKQVLSPPNQSNSWKLLSEGVNALLDHLGGPYVDQNGNQYTVT